MTRDAALSFFSAIPRLIQKLKVLDDVGLGYLRLGQSATTLSGGEAQRLKLALYLSTASGHTGEPYLFLFDEPTTGLHLTDIHTLVHALRKLLASDHSIIVVEHNIELLAHADYILDLGPEGGHEGGTIVAEGTPETVMDCPQSFTGHFLKDRLSVSPEKITL